MSFSVLTVAACAVGPTPSPDGSDAPDAASLESSSAVFAPLEVGTRAVRRLSEAEYRRSIHDLLGADVPTDIDLPADADTRGFRNQSDALEVSQTLLDAYEAIAERVVASALRRPGAAPLDHAPATRTGPESSLAWDGAFRTFEQGWHRIELGVWTEGMGVAPADAHITLWVDSFRQPDLSVSFEAEPLDRTVAVEVELAPGLHTLGITLDQVRPELIALYGPTVSGPSEPFPNPARDTLVRCDLDAQPADCTRETVGRVATHALRRPVTAAELDGWLALATDRRTAGDSNDDALGVALRAVLMSPRFLFHIEHATGGPLNAYEVAARLASLLWGSVPDDALLDHAADGSLLTQAGLSAEIDRMLADKRSEAVAEDLLADWFGADGLAGVTPDRTVYPEFDEALRTAMHDELFALLNSFVGTDRPIRELMTSPVASVSPRLATHYGLAQSGPSVRVDGVGRLGLLGTAAVQTYTANPNRTSPTRRGRFVLERLLCDPPQAPPPGVPPLAEGASTEDMIAAHAADPVCAACHTKIDPLGVALEHFDGVGAWRDDDHGSPVTAVGTLPDGTTLVGLTALAEHIADDPAWTQCLATQIFTWGLGAPPPKGEPVVAKIQDALSGEDGSLDKALHALMSSSRFLDGEAGP